MDTSWFHTLKSRSDTLDTSITYKLFGKSWLAITFCALSLTSGCTTTATYWDENAVRRQTLRYYNTEVMENLIRARYGMLFVHVDITQLQAAVTSNYTGTIGYGQTLTNASTNQTTLAGQILSAAQTAANTAMRPLSFSVTPQRQNVITEQAKPTFGDEADVYSAYVQFLNIQRPDQDLNKMESHVVDFSRVQTIQRVDDPHTLRKDDYLPETLKRWQGSWYYVPSRFISQYFQLCLQLMQRPKVSTKLPKGTSKTDWYLERNYRATLENRALINSGNANQTLLLP